MSRPYAFRQLVLARLRQFFREPMTVFWVYGFPLLLAMILGAAFKSGRTNPPIVDIAIGSDPARAEQAAEALRKKDVPATARSEEQCRERLKTAVSSLYVKLDASEPGTFEYIYDPARAESVLARQWTDAILARAAAARLPEAVDHRVIERGSTYIDFLLPGLVGINLMGGGLFGVGFVLVDMRVRKLFKRLLATPLHRGDFLLSMLAARLIFLVPEMFSLLVVARWLFDVPVFGSYLTLAVVILIGALSFAGLGLLLACRTDKIETISGLINLCIMPMYLLSGVFFSSRRFPDVVQPFIQALPLTQLNEALRAVMLEGAGLDRILERLAILAAWGIVSFFLALRWFKWS